MKSSIFGRATASVVSWSTTFACASQFWLLIRPKINKITDTHFSRRVVNFCWQKRGCGKTLRMTSHQADNFERTEKERWIFKRRKWVTPFCLIGCLPPWQGAHCTSREWRVCFRTRWGKLDRACTPISYRYCEDTDSKSGLFHISLLECWSCWKVTSAYEY